MTELERVDALIAALRDHMEFTIDDEVERVIRRSNLKQQLEDVTCTIPFINIDRSKWEEIERLRNDKILCPVEKMPFNYFKA